MYIIYYTSKYKTTRESFVFSGLAFAARGPASDHRHYHVDRKLQSKPHYILLLKKIILDNNIIIIYIDTYNAYKIIYSICNVPICMLLWASGSRIDTSNRVSENVCVDCASGEVVVFVVYHLYISTNPLLAIRDTIMIKGHRRACDNDTPAVYACVLSCMR